VIVHDLKEQASPEDDVLEEAKIYLATIQRF